MSDFDQFAAHARDQFRDLHLHVSIEQGAGARGLTTKLYKLRATGQAIGPDPCLGQGDTPELAIQSLISRVGPARRAVKATREHAQNDRATRR